MVNRSTTEPMVMRQQSFLTFGRYFSLPVVGIVSRQFLDKVTPLRLARDLSETVVSMLMNTRLSRGSAREGVTERDAGRGEPQGGVLVSLGEGLL